jgi:hypothetical protein
MDKNALEHLKLILRNQSPSCLLLLYQDDQLDLLCRVLTAGLEEAGVERGANEDEDEALQVGCMCHIMETCINNHHR